MSKIIACQSLMRYWGGCHIVPMSMSLVVLRDRNCLFDLDQPEVVIGVCLEQAAFVDSVVLGDFSVADYAMCVAPVFQLLE